MWTQQYTSMLICTYQIEHFKKQQNEKSISKNTYEHQCQRRGSRAECSLFLPVKCTFFNYENRVAYQIQHIKQWSHQHSKIIFFIILIRKAEMWQVFWNGGSIYILSGHFKHKYRVWAQATDSAKPISRTVAPPFIIKKGQKCIQRAYFIKLNKKKLTALSIWFS